jgi:hypothetical protein
MIEPGNAPYPGCAKVWISNGLLLAPEMSFTSDEFSPLTANDLQC